MNISSDVEMNEYKFLDTKLKELVNALKLLGMSYFLEFFKQLKEEGKIKSDDIENELLKYTKLNERKLRYMLIIKFKDKLASLKTILKEMEELEIITQRKMEQIDKIKEDLEELEIKNDEFEKLDENLRISMLRNRFLERLNNIEDEIKLRNVTRKKITEIDILKTELKKTEELNQWKTLKLMNYF